VGGYLHGSGIKLQLTDDVGLAIKFVIVCDIT
jgi:hypothetical protein